MPKYLFKSSASSVSSSEQSISDPAVTVASDLIIPNAPLSTSADSALPSAELSLGHDEEVDNDEPYTIGEKIKHVMYDHQVLINTFVAGSLFGSMRVVSIADIPRWTGGRGK
jgi:hypothetical protein